MATYSYKKDVPFRDILKSTRVLFRLAWETDRITVILFYLTAIVGGLVTLGTSYVLKLLIDQLQAGQMEALTSVPIIITFTLAAYYLVSLIRSLFFHTFHLNYLDYILRNQLQNALTKQYVTKVSQLDIAHFEDAKTQDLLSQVHATMKWQVPDIMRLLGYVTTELFAYLSAVIILIPFGWWIPLVVTAITIPRLYLRSKYGALQWSIWGAGAPEVRKLYYYDGLFANHISIREMKIAQSGPALIEKYGRIQDYLFGLNKKVLKDYLRVSIIPPMVELGIIFAIAYAFLGDVLDTSISIGTFTLLVSMLSQVNSAAGRASSNFGSLYERGLYLYNYAQVMDIEPLLKHDPNATKIPVDTPPSIEFKNVSFAYPGGKEVLHNISFTIQPGDSIALVGHNGAGKSTIINLLCRFYDVTEGEILINGVNIKSIDIKSWYKSLGTLFQTYVQYHFSVRENIAFEEPAKAMVESLQAAAEKSGAHAFIQKMTDGYEQQLGKEFEGGMELSGGQWQKLAIARAFYAQAPILILDEPTSAIDAEAEYEIFNNLEETYQNKSLILVSHRFSTVRNADKIYVIDEGRIIEGGSHAELLAKNGRYATMFLAQAEGYQ